MLKAAYLKKAILFLESEIDLLKLLFLQSNRPTDKAVKSCKSKVYFIPKSKDGLGIDGMGEIVVSFDLSRHFFDEEGKPAPFIHIAEALENAFNFSFGDVYKSKSRIFMRKSYNLTKALDYLKNLIVRDNRNKKMKKDDFV